MARKHEAEKLLREGSYPSEIARHMGISVKSVIQYLRTRVGEGSLRLSDVYFSWTPEKREVLGSTCRLVREALLELPQRAGSPAWAWAAYYPRGRVESTG